MNCVVLARVRRWNWNNSPVGGIGDLDETKFQLGLVQDCLCDRIHLDSG